MKYFVKHFSLLLLLICFSPVLHAQLIIAKDPRECLVGLKDSSGNWVVPPAYTHIGYYGQHYKILSGEKQGIMSWSGKLLVPAIYDKVEHGYCEAPGMRDHFLSKADQESRWRYSSWFIITNGLKVGVAAPDGRVIVPASLTSLTHFFNGIAIGVDAQNQSVLVDTTGILCTLPADCSMRPEPGSMLATKRFLVARKGVNDKGEATVLYGVCDERGKFVIPTIYRGFRQRLWRLNVLVADSAGYSGIFSLNGKQLSPCYYGMPQTPALDEYTFNDFAFISRNGRTGVLGRDGKIIVPCAYDSVSVVRKSIGETFFLCHNGTHDDLYSDTRAILVNHEYDEVRIAHSNNSYLHQLVLLLVKKNEKWGALSESLEEYMPVLFDTVFTDEYYFLFYSDSSVRALYPDNLYNERTMVMVPDPEERTSSFKHNNPYDPYFGYNDTIGQTYIWHTYDDESGNIIDTLYLRSLAPVASFCEVIVHDVWTADSVHLIWELPVLTEYLPTCEENQYRHDATSCFAVVHNSKWFKKIEAYKYPIGNTLYICTTVEGPRIYKSTGGASIVPRSEKTRFYLRTHSEEDTTGFIQIYTSTGKEGAMDLNGDMILDTMWYGYRALNADTFWVATQQRIDPYYYYEDECKPAWNLYSYKQNKLLLDTQNQLLAPPAIEAGETGIALTATGVGFFDTKTLRFTIAPVYRYIYPLDDSLRYFLVTGFDGVTHITDREGKVILQSAVEQATIVNKTSYTPAHSIDSFLVCSIRTSRATFIAGNSGLHNYKSLNRDSLFTFLQQQPELHMYNGRAHHIPRAIIDSTLVLIRWQRELLCDSFILGSLNFDCRADDHGNFFSGLYQQTHTRCTLWPVKKHISFSEEARNPVYAPVWNNTRVFCFSIYQDVYRDPSCSYETYFLGRDSVPVKQQLSDLFINDQWKPVVINALLARLDSQPQIRANCTDVTRYPDLLANRFLVTADSLLLFPDWGMERYLSNPQICVAISWSELVLFLKPEVKSILEIQ